MHGAITGTFGMSIHVHDLGKATRFWESLGLKPLHTDADTAVFAVPQSGPLLLHKWQSACATNGGRPPGTVSGIMLAVDDAKAVCERLEAAGGKVTVPPFLAGTGGHWAIAADPEGNDFMLCAPK